MSTALAILGWLAIAIVAALLIAILAAVIVGIARTPAHLREQKAKRMVNDRTETR